MLLSLYNKKKIHTFEILTVTENKNIEKEYPEKLMASNLPKGFRPSKNTFS